MTPPPGWYADPSGQPQWRWWDGTTWTPHVAPVAPARVDPRPLVEAERSLTRWVTLAFAAQAVAAVIVPWVLVRFFRLFQPLMTGPIESLEAGPSPSAIASMIPLMIGQQLVSLLSLAGLVVSGLWLYRAAAAAGAVGIPARHDPAWAVAGWFIPIINFWWPCQSLQDLLPLGHPTRGTIVWVWVPFVIAPFVMMGGVVAAGFVAGAAPLLLVALGAMMTAAGWLSAIRLAPVVLTEHERLAAAG